MPVLEYELKELTENWNWNKELFFIIFIQNIIPIITEELELISKVMMKWASVQVGMRHFEKIECS